MSDERPAGGFAECPFPLRFRRSLRAKRLRLIVRADGVECVLPAICPEPLAHDFVRQHRDWLTRKFREAMAQAPDRTFWEEACASSLLHFPLHGTPQPFSISTGGARQARLRCDGKQIVLTLPPGDASTQAAMIERAVYTWGRVWLKERVDAMLRHHARQLRVQPRDLRIKRMRTRWGSCGARNDINLNWLLITAPPNVLEYVIVHELCHIRQRDHSPRFWHLVGMHCPTFLQSRAWLKVEGGYLLRRFGECR